MLKGREVILTLDGFLLMPMEMMTDTTTKPKAKFQS